MTALELRDPLTIPPAKRAADRLLGDLRFRRLLPEGEWQALPRKVRQRFTKRCGPGCSTVYAGRIMETRFKLAGWLLATACRVIDAPLPLPAHNVGCAAIVTVTEDRRTGGQIWTRQYSRPGLFPQVVHSRKAFQGETGIEECVGLGVGMSLQLEASEAYLRFVSQRYFIRIGGWRMCLPHWMTPGRMVIAHRDLGRGRFEFTLTLTHFLLGELIYQRALFHDMKEA